jgi:hypothetical protein
MLDRKRTSSAQFHRPGLGSMIGEARSLGGPTDLRRLSVATTATRRPSTVKSLMIDAVRNKSISQADQIYLNVRMLRRHANTLELWGLCVGVVICGEFSGWQVHFLFNSQIGMSSFNYNMFVTE